jgi:HEAT repeat protein
MKACAVLLLASALAIGAGCSDPSKGLASSDPSEVVTSVKELARAGRDADVERISQATTHADTMVATEAVRCLGSIRREKAVEALSRVVTEEKRPPVREAAVLELGRQTSDPPIRVLEQTVQHDADSRVRGAAATSLARLRAWDQIPLLMDVAEKDPDPVVRSRAVGAIETMLGVKFGYELHGMPEQQHKALARMRSIAMKAAATLRDAEARRNGRG